MPGSENDDKRAGEARAQPRAEVKVILNPEDTVGLLLNPAYISLGLTAELFRKDVGGTAAE